MELSEQDRRFVDGYLQIPAGKSGLWKIGLAVGALLAAGAAVYVIVSGATMLAVLLLVLGLVVIEVSIEHHRKRRLARILQEYEAELERLRTQTSQQDDG